MQNSDFRTRITCLCGSQTSPMVFCIQNSDFSTRIASLYGTQPSSVVLCIHNSVIMTRINSLYGSKTSPIIFVHAKQRGLAPELLVSMGPRPHLSFCACKTAWLAPEILVSMGPRPVVLCIKNNVSSIIISSLYWCQPSSALFTCKTVLLGQNYKSLWVPALICGFLLAKTATLGPELQVSLGPNPHLRFLRAKQQLLDQNYKSLWAPGFACWFVNAKQCA